MPLQKTYDSVFLLLLVNFKVKIIFLAVLVLFDNLSSNNNISVLVVFICDCLDLHRSKSLFHGCRGGGRGHLFDRGCLRFLFDRKGDALGSGLAIGIRQEFLFGVSGGVSVQKGQDQRLFVGLGLGGFVLGHFDIFRRFGWTQILGQGLHVGCIELFGVVFDALAGGSVRSQCRHFLGQLLQMDQLSQAGRKLGQLGTLVQVLPQIAAAVDHEGSSPHGRAVGSLAAGQFGTRSRLEGLVGNRDAPVLGGLRTGPLVAIVLFHGQFAAVVVTGILCLECLPDLQDLVLELVVSVLSGGNGIFAGDTPVDQIKGLVPGVVGLVGGGGRLRGPGLFDALQDLGEEL